MSTEEPSVPADGADRLRKWQIAVAALSVLSLTLLLINLVLRARADAAVTERQEAVTRADSAVAEAAAQQRRNEELLTQLSTSNERLAELTGQVPERDLGPADANVERQVAAQRAAERAAQRAGSAVQRARAESAAVRAQLRNAQTCAAGGLLALAQIHAGPDIESGADDAAATLDSVLAACRAGLE
jgi:hypothetical protein